MNEDKAIANVSLLRACLLLFVFTSIIVGISSLIVTRGAPTMGWATIYMPVIIPLELIALGLSAYMVLVGASLAMRRGGLLRLRRDVLIYLGVFRFKNSDIDHVEFQRLGPFAMKSVVVHLKSGGRRKLSLVLAGQSLEELQQSAAF